jgi:hypothetical protein
MKVRAMTAGISHTTGEKSIVKAPNTIPMVEMHREATTSEKRVEGTNPCRPQREKGKGQGKSYQSSGDSDLFNAGLKICEMHGRPSRAVMDVERAGAIHR